MQRHLDKLKSNTRSIWKPKAEEAGPSNASDDSRVSNDGSPFAYAPLPPGTIRLLSPVSRELSSGHNWRVETVKIEGAKFDALSYTWGSQDETFDISLNGRSFRVHHNLYTALPYLATRRRRTSQRLPIWIDAICINQRDKEEVAQQVMFMHTIYGKARMVWIWLGLTEVQSWIPEAIKLLHDIIKAGQKTNDVELIKDLCLSKLDPALWDAVSHLLHNPWYLRVWVVQEAALPRSMVFLCGEHEIEPEIIESSLELVDRVHVPDALGNMISGGMDARHAWGNIFSTRQMVQSTLNDTHQCFDHELIMIASYFMTLCNSQCLLAEDRVRALLGFSDPSDPWHQNLLHAPSTNSLYISFSRYLLSENVTSNLRFWWLWLDLAFSSVRTSDLPSWVPDFHRAAAVTAEFRSVREYAPESRVQRRASGKNTAFSLGERTNEVLFRGKSIDEVVQVLRVLRRRSHQDFRSERFQALDDQCRMLGWMDMADSCLDQGQETPALGDLIDKNLRHLDTCWKFVLCINEYSKTEGYVRFRSGLNYSKEIAAKYNDLHKLHDSDMQEPDWNHVTYVAHMGSWKHRANHPGYSDYLMEFQDKQLFLTRKGRLGFTLQGVKPGDSVCVLHGSEFPHILKKVEDTGEGEKWRFLGEAIVHGLMDGEADKMEVDDVEFCMV